MKDSTYAIRAFGRETCRVCVNRICEKNRKCKAYENLKKKLSNKRNERRYK